MVRIRLGEAEDLAGVVDDCDVIVLAALVGADGDDKARVLARLAERVRPGTGLVARGAAGLRRLLYPDISPTDLRGLVAARMLTDNAVVNSVTVAVRR